MSPKPRFPLFAAAVEEFRRRQAVAQSTALVVQTPPLTPERHARDLQVLGLLHRYDPEGCVARMAKGGFECVVDATGSLLELRRGAAVIPVHGVLPELSGSEERR